MIVIPIADLNSQAIECVLDDELFYIIFDWNDDGQYWEMGIRNSAYRTLVDGISVVVNHPLLKQFKYPDLPTGELQVTHVGYTNGPPNRNDLVGEAYQLIYTNHIELVALINAV